MWAVRVSNSQILMKAKVNQISNALPISNLLIHYGDIRRNDPLFFYCSFFAKISNVKSPFLTSNLFSYVIQYINFNINARYTGRVRAGWELFYSCSYYNLQSPNTLWYLRKNYALFCLASLLRLSPISFITI